MIQRLVKLKLTKKQEHILHEWCWILTGVYNWAIRKIELDAKNKIYPSRMEFQNLLANHGKKLEIPSHVLQGELSLAYDAWARCFKKIARKPRFKGNRNKLNSIPFPDPIRAPKKNRIHLPGLKSVRFHKQELPEVKIKCGRIVKRASGWYLCLVMDAIPNEISLMGNGEIGIDPGFKHLLTLSTGEKIPHPRELEANLKRLGQAQRGNKKKLVARIQERITNQRRDRNHKLSRRLISENSLLCFSKDNLRGISRKFGKSVASSAIGQLRQMLRSKAVQAGRCFVEVPSKFSTLTCSVCESLTGPQGWDGLAVRQWRCSFCGTIHDRDVNAARNTLIAGAGYAHERVA